jgi:hypothetical protein
VYHEINYDQQTKVLLLVDNYKNKNILYISNSLYVVKEEVKFMATKGWINILVKEWCEICLIKLEQIVLYS